MKKESSKNCLKDKKWIGMVLPSLLLIIAASLMLYPIDTLMLASEGKDIEAIRIKSEDYFSISFRHSVNKGLVKEVYQIDRKNQSIALCYAVFENYGAGMLDTLPEGTSLTEQGTMLRIDFPNKKIKGVNYASAGIAGHQLGYDGDKYSLFEEKPYKTIHISVRRISLFHYLRLKI